MLRLFEECAGHAEELRREGARVVFVTGCELSLFAAGFLPGADVFTPHRGRDGGRAADRDRLATPPGSATSCGGGSRTASRWR
jgi:hypothetical protein